MTPSKCPICTKTKGRRVCLMNDDALICSRCCAEMRNVSQCAECEHFSRTEIIAHKKAVQSGDYSVEKEHPEIEDQLHPPIIEQPPCKKTGYAMMTYPVGVKSSLEA